MKTYEDYLASQEPKFTLECARCKRRYFSDDGENWVEYNGERYSYKPCRGWCCIECETAEAVNDTNHWAVQDVLHTEKAIKEILRTTLGRLDKRSRDEAFVKFSKFLLLDEDYQNSARDYLNEHWADVYAELEETY